MTTLRMRAAETESLANQTLKEAVTARGRLDADAAITAMEIFAQRAAKITATDTREIVGGLEALATLVRLHAMYAPMFAPHLPAIDAAISALSRLGGHHDTRI